jgi:hypothetical protein
VQSDQVAIRLCGKLRALKNHCNFVLYRSPRAHQQTVLRFFQADRATCVASKSNTAVHGLKPEKQLDSNSSARINPAEVWQSSQRREDQTRD